MPNKRYDSKYLQQFTSENQITLSNDYTNTNIKSDTIIKGICKNIECQDPYEKRFSSLVSSGGYCKRCKLESTNLSKIGCKHSFQSQDVREKMRKTNLEKIGVAYPAQSPEILQKMFDKYKERYPNTLPDQPYELQFEVYKKALVNGNVYNDLKREYGPKPLYLDEFKKYKEFGGSVILYPMFHPVTKSLRGEESMLQAKARIYLDYVGISLNPLDQNEEIMSQVKPITICKKLTTYEKNEKSEKIRINNSYFNSNCDRLNTPDKTYKYVINDNGQISIVMKDDPSIVLEIIREGVTD